MNESGKKKGEFFVLFTFYSSKFSFDLRTSLGKF